MGVVAENTNLFARLDIEYLAGATDPKDFRARARSQWRVIVSELKAGAGWDGFSRSSAEGKKRRQAVKDALRPLLLQGDKESFLSALKDATEVQDRIFDELQKEQESLSALKAAEQDSIFDDADFEHYAERCKHAKVMADQEPEAVRLALSLKHDGIAPSAEALAQKLKISRPALYRTYKAGTIQKALKSLRAIEAGSAGSE